MSQCSSLSLIFFSLHSTQQVLTATSPFTSSRVWPCVCLVAWAPLQKPLLSFKSLKLEAQPQVPLSSKRKRMLSSWRQDSFLIQPPSSLVSETQCTSIEFLFPFFNLWIIFLTLLMLNIKIHCSVFPPQGWTAALCSASQSSENQKMPHIHPICACLYNACAQSHYIVCISIRHIICPPLHFISVLTTISL